MTLSPLSPDLTPGAIVAHGGHAFRIVVVTTPAGEEAEGRPNLARHLREGGFAAVYYMTHCDGAVPYMAHVWTDGRTSVSKLK